MNNSICFLRTLKRLLPAAIVLAASLWLAIAADGLSKESSPAKAPPAERTSTVFCACCADQGAWFQRSRDISEYEHEMFAELKFQTARLHLTAGEDDWRGISAAGESLEEDFALAFAPAPSKWTLIFKTKRGESGRLILTLPAKATELGADTSDALPPRSPVSLYKELRIEGAVRGTGVFAQGNAPGTKYRLVLQGNGNQCWAVDDYYRWNLQVHGAKASYTFYGLFAKPR